MIKKNILIVSPQNNLNHKNYSNLYLFVIEFCHLVDECFGVLLPVFTDQPSWGLRDEKPQRELKLIKKGNKKN